MFKILKHQSTWSLGHLTLAIMVVFAVQAMLVVPTADAGNLSSCGNGVIDTDEACDGTNLNNQTCKTQGYSVGTLQCYSDCYRFSFSYCKNCSEASRQVQMSVNIMPTNNKATYGEPTDLFSFTIHSINKTTIVKEFKINFITDSDTSSGSDPTFHVGTMLTDAKLLLNGQEITQSGDSVVSSLDGHYLYFTLSNPLNIGIDQTVTLILRASLRNQKNNSNSGSIKILDEAIIFGNEDDVENCYNSFGTGKISISGQSTAICGNGTIDSGEVCDGTNLNGKTCESKGYSGGTLKCSDNCQSFNVADCANSSSINSCTDSDGSDIKTSPYTKGYVTGKNAKGVSYKYYDECSGSGLQINEMWCYEFVDGKAFGKLVYTCPNGCVDGACKKTDSGLCGNGIIDPGEVCDGENLNNQTCVGKGYDEGKLKCSDDCKAFNKMGCIKASAVAKARAVKDSDGEVTLKLSRLISELEKKILNLERQLTKKINQALAKRLRGMILIQPESKGEVWFIHPETGKRFYIKDGQAAYEILSGMGQGITATDLEKVPLGYDERVNQGLVDSDGDKLPDVLEDAIGSDKTKTDTDGDGYSDLSEYQGGYKLTGVGRYALNNSFAAKLRGIYLDVDHRGSAWYIKNGLRYYISPENGYNVMRFLSLGVSNDDIRELAVGEVSEDDSASQNEDDSNQNEDLIQ